MVNFSFFIYFAKTFIIFICIKLTIHCSNTFFIRVQFSSFLAGYGELVCESGKYGEFNYLY